MKLNVSALANFFVIDQLNIDLMYIIAKNLTIIWIWICFRVAWFFNNLCSFTHDCNIKFRSISKSIKQWALCILSETFINTDIINACDNRLFIAIFNDLIMNIRLSLFSFLHHDYESFVWMHSWNTLNYKFYVSTFCMIST